MADPSVRTRSGLVQVVLLVIALDVTATQTIVVSVLPALSERLHVPVTGAAWLLTVFMLTSGVVTPLAGRLGDLFGYRRMLIACLAFLAIGSTVAAASDAAGSYPGVFIGRVLPASAAPWGWSSPARSSTRGGPRGCSGPAWRSP